MNMLTAEISVNIGGVNVTLNLSVPQARTDPSIVMPLLWELTDAAEQIAVSRVNGEGQTISCTKGCGACCRQFVPIAPLEARYLSEYVNQLPSEQRDTIMSRFDHAREQLEQAGLVEKLLNFSDLDENLEELGLRYFNLGIACPFLEEESCSIHPVRPLRCREYLVTNPAKYCQQPSRETINLIPFPAHLSHLLAGLGANWSKYTDWAIPLSLAPVWLERHPEELPMRESKTWIEEVLTSLSKKKKSENAKRTLMMEKPDLQDN
jgi:Fe-S-cluster containining protein